VGCAWFFFLALFNMPLANLIAILQALPLTITLMGAIFLGERVGWRRWSMILLGFAGVLLIVRPGTEGFDRYAVFALISVLFVAVRDLATRRMSASVPSLRVAFWSAFGVTIFGAIGSLTEDWVMPTAPQALSLVIAAVAILGGYLLVILAVRRGDLAVVTPYRYTGLLWALLLGWLVFGEWPDRLTMAGAALIVATGLYTFYREHQLARAARHTARTLSASTP
jgi:drug/metabolite transporter (DMT)-like permease